MSGDVAVNSASSTTLGMVQKVESKRKRKRLVLTIQQKVDVINALAGGTPVTNLCKQYSVGSSTIYDIKANRKQILHFYKGGRDESQRAQRKSQTLPPNLLVETFLSNWVKQCHDKGIATPGPMIVKKAKSIHKELGLADNCTYSNGWLARFKRRFNICQGTETGHPAEKKAHSSSQGTNVEDINKQITTTPKTTCDDKQGSPEKKMADANFCSMLVREMQALPDQKKSHLKLKIMNLVMESVKEHEIQLSQLEAGEKA